MGKLIHVSRLGFNIGGAYEDGKMLKVRMTGSRSVITDMSGTYGQHWSSCISYPHKERV